jgi:hypothetical protein
MMCLHCLSFIVLWIAKRHCIRMPEIVSKLKGEKNVFSYTIHIQADSLQSFSPLLFHRPLPPFSDVAEARSYFASTVLIYSEVRW